MTPELKFQKPSDQQRRDILLLEAAAILHDLYKLTDRFIQGHQGTGRPYGAGSFRDDPAYGGLRDELAQIRIAPAVGAGEVNLRDLLFPPEEGRSETAKLILGMHGLHGKAHFEKEASPAGKQSGETYIATPFGQETLLSSLDETFQALTPWLTSERLEEMAGSSRLAWLDAVRPLLSQGLADTQRPANEVTLWDWGYTVAVLLKPVAYAGYQTGRWPDQQNPLDDFQYRPLVVRVDRLELYGRADRISDLLGLREAVDASCEDVRRLLEETYAIANRYFQDATGEYYLLPQLGPEEQGKLRAAVLSCFPADLRPRLDFGGDDDRQITPGLLDNQQTRQRAVAGLVVEPRRTALAAREHPMDPDNLSLEDYARAWEDGRPPNAEICTVCGFRPVGYPRPGSASEKTEQLDEWAKPDKAQKRNVCRVCLGRRQRRSQDWLEDLAYTIWTDEVADGKGRLALVVARLGLDGWLDGTALESVMTKVQPPLSKRPSPARLVRIAQAGRDFWQEFLSTIEEDASFQRSDRLAIRPKGVPSNVIASHAYELSAGDVPLAVVWDGANGQRRFVTAENLTYYRARGGADPRSWVGKTVTVLEPSGFLAPTEQRGQFAIATVEPLGSYTPLIPLLVEPDLFMALVPAGPALELVRRLRRIYLAQMERVADRLPLSVGLVYFRQRMPITAVLDAGRRFLTLPEAGESWQASVHGSGDAWEVTFTQDGREFIRRYRQKMGDGQTEDSWYLRLRRAGAWAELASLAGEGGPSAVEIWPGSFDFEYLEVAARRFEIAYGADRRRLTRPTRPWPLDDLDRLTRVWKNVELLSAAQIRAVIAVIEATRELWQLPTGAAALTDATLRRFVEDTLATAAWPKAHPWPLLSDETRRELIEAATTGELADLSELFLEIMKDRQPAGELEKEVQI